jgi:hypothetical protein
VAGIDWTTAHGQDPPEGCSVVSKIEHGKFVPTFGESGMPFHCLQANPLCGAQRRTGVGPWVDSPA